MVYYSGEQREARLPMARFGKYTFVIYLLSALAALELIALAAVLAGPAR